MKRILVPVDFSPTSVKAFKYAADIALHTSASITLYHLYTPEKSTTLGMFQNVREYNRQLEVNALKKLQRLKKKVLDNSFDGSVTTLVGRTPVVNNVLGFAEDNEMDMIVMGTQGASGLKKITVGSVAAKIIKNSSIPVLLVPEKFEWKQPENIVLTTDFKNLDKKTLRIVFELARVYDALVTIVNLTGPIDENNEAGKKKFNSWLLGIQEEFSDCRMQFRQIKTTSIIKTMENLQAEISCDLLVMIRRKLGVLERFFEKSFTRKMAHVTSQPLLVMPFQ